VRACRLRLVVFGSPVLGHRVHVMNHTHELEASHTGTHTRQTLFMVGIQVVEMHGTCVKDVFSCSPLSEESALHKPCTV